MMLELSPDEKAAKVRPSSMPDRSRRSPPRVSAHPIPHSTRLTSKRGGQGGWK